MKIIPLFQKRIVRTKFDIYVFIKERVTDAFMKKTVNKGNNKITELRTI